MAKLKIFNPKFKEDFEYVVAQVFLSTIAIAGIFNMLKGSTNDLPVIGALTSSSFIAFSVPQAKVSQARFLIGGYVIGTLVGISFNYSLELLSNGNLEISKENLYILFLAMSMGVSLFLMVALDMMHPPAAALATTYMASMPSTKTVTVVLLGIVLIFGTKKILQPMLKNII